MSRRHHDRERHHNMAIAPNWQLRFSILFVAVTLFGVGVASPYALITLAFDGLSAAIVLFPPMLAGLWVMHFTRLDNLPLRWHLLLGASFGLGGLSLAILLGGVCGVLHRPVWIIIYAVLTTIGIVRVRYLWHRFGHNATPTALSDKSLNFIGALLLLACPFAIMSLLAAVNAPGLIWQEEGFGYDVLEYHLQLPKEYLADGLISYRPHNVYGNFPANVEMLYLSAMIINGEHVDVGVVANLIHTALLWLTIFAAWVVGTDWSPRAGAVSAVALGTSGWIPYLSGLAYNEGGMLLFGMVATGLALRALRTHNQNMQHIDRPWTLWLLAGAMSGLACGCKYTAGPMIAVPLCLTTLWTPAVSKKRRLGFMCVFFLATLATLSPWLIKNTVATGNPVFPLINQTFKAQPTGWSSAQDAQWTTGHQPSANEQRFTARLTALWKRIVMDEHQRFGPFVILLAIAGIALRRIRREEASLVWLLIVQLTVWMFATHLYARFAVVIMIPLVLLTGSILRDTMLLSVRTCVFTLLSIGCLWNGYFTSQLIAKEAIIGAPSAIFYDGMLSGYEYLRTINHELPMDAKLLMIGDAKAYYIRRDVDYCVVFNHCDFIDTVRSHSDLEIVDWLRDSAYTHVLVSWLEIKRLRRTYGFPEEITKELFDRLSKLGLRVQQEFDHPANIGRYITLYEINPQH